MSFHALCRHHGWAIILVPVAVAALFQARGIAQIVGFGLGPNATELAGATLVSRRASVERLAAHIVSAEAILSRNPFDSLTGRLDGDGDPPQAAPVDVNDPMNAPLCDGLSVHVITTSADPDWSLAAMTVNGDSKSVLRRRGGAIGGKTVQFVGTDRVWLAGKGALCQLEMWRPVADKPVREHDPPPPLGTPGVGVAIDPWILKGIVRVSATDFKVDRAVVDKILESPDLMRQAQVVPEQDANGKTIGIRLVHVRPDSLLGVLGMENGDRLQTINGFDMTNPEKVLEAYARLRTADHLTVQLNRRGSNMNLDYNIE